ncbi:MAG: hypothetical protein ACHQVK_02050 [Candidatus Paceibacterales bacterium]
MNNRKLEAIIPLTFLVISGIIFIPAFGAGLSFKSGLFIHYASFLILGVFFEIPELSLNAWCLLKVRNKDGLAGSNSLFKKIFEIRYILTHYLAPSAGIMTISSGLYLILLSKDSLTQGWLFWLLCTSVIGLYKGIIQHRFYIKKILCLFQGRKEIVDLPYYVHSPFDNICIFSECPTYVFNYWLACSKPLWLSNPFFVLILHLEQLLNSRALVGVLIVGLGSFLVIPLRFLIKKYSRVYPL